MARGFKMGGSSGSSGAKVYVDDVKTNAKEIKLTSTTKVVTPPYNFIQGGIVYYNGEIHILGGGNSSSDDTTLKHLKWDGSNWIEVSTLPYNFYYGSAVVYNGAIHILGGQDNVRKHYKWDGSSWTSVSTLPYDFYGGAAVVYNSAIHILGSMVSGYKTKHYVLNGSSWDSSVSYSGTDSCAHNCAYVMGGKIHILYRNIGTDQNKSVEQTWDGTSSSWSHLTTDAPIRTESGVARIAVANSYVYMMNARQYDKGVYRSSGNGTWTSLSTTYSPESGPGAGFIYVKGQFYYIRTVFTQGSSPTAMTDVTKPWYEVESIT